MQPCRTTADTRQINKTASIIPLTRRAVCLAWHGGDGKRLGSGGYPIVVHLAHSLGAAAVVMSPASLREEITGDLQRQLAAYAATDALRMS